MGKRRVSPPRQALPIPILLAVLIGIAVAACDAVGTTPGASPEPSEAVDLVDSHWVLRSIGGAEPIGELSLAFTPDGADGSTGCNTFRGDYTLDGSSLVFDPLATTKRGCEQPLMDQEAAILEALGGVTSWEIGADGALTLRGTTELVYDPANQ
jgi:heat shock protein HslJ